MANFSQFKTDVVDLSGLSNVENALPLLTRIAQDTVRRRYTPTFLKRLINIAISSDTFTFPADMERIVAVRLWDGAGGSVRLVEVPEMVGRNRTNPTTQPSTATLTSGLQSEVFYWRESGGLARLSITPPSAFFIELDYIINDVYLVNATDTNLWLENVYDLMLFAVLVELMAYVGDATKHALYSARVSQSIVDIQRGDVADEVSGREYLLKGGLNA